jgi:transcriptional regulator with XRE-family HTH domain
VSTARLPGSRGRSPGNQPRAPEAVRVAYGRALRTSRENAGLTLVQLGARVGLSIAALSRYENGEVLPADEVQARLETALRAPEATREARGPLGGLEPWVRMAVCP